MAGWATSALAIRRLPEAGDSANCFMEHSSSPFGNRLFGNHRKAFVRHKDFLESFKAY
jgi:hypothetical protein